GRQVGGIRNRGAPEHRRVQHVEAAVGDRRQPSRLHEPARALDLGRVGLAYAQRLRAPGAGALDLLAPRARAVEPGGLALEPGAGERDLLTPELLQRRAVPFQQVLAL